MPFGGDGGDRVELIPTIRAEDPRYTRDGQIGNMRVQVTLTEHPGFALEFNGAEVAWECAEIIRKALSANFSRGLDARGDALPKLDHDTVKRRERRQRQAFKGGLATAAWKKARGKKAKAKVAQQHADTIGSYLVSLQDRFRLRGRNPSGKSQYGGPVDMSTPFHESGLIAENVNVTYKSRDRGEPVFLISWPTGGQGRGLHTDDGRGARLFAVKHYGLDRMADIPRIAEAALEQALDNHLSRILALSRTGGFQALAHTVDQFEHAVAEVSDGEPER